MKIEIENSLAFLLSNFTNSFRYALENRVNETGLHSGQAFVLFSLWREDGQSQISLAQDLNLTAPTINKMVRNLEANDFVSCRKCGADGRVVRVYLTDKGRRSETLVKQQWERLEAESFANLTETEKLVFAQLLNKLKENFIKKDSSG